MKDIFLIIGACLLLGLIWVPITMAYEKAIATDFFIRNRRTIVCLIVAAVAGFVVFLWPSTVTWEGEGQISAFPRNDSTKNYRLDSNSIEVSMKKRGWFHKEYSYVVSSAAWPDGGTLEFSKKCKISYPDTLASCDSNSGTFKVEVTSPPPEPDGDDGGGSN